MNNGKWRCAICGTDYAEDVKGCPQCEPVGIRSGVVYDSAGHFLPGWLGHQRYRLMNRQDPFFPLPMTQVRQGFEDAVVTVNAVPQSHDWSQAFAKLDSLRRESAGLRPVHGQITIEIDGKKTNLTLNIPFHQAEELRRRIRDLTVEFAFEQKCDAHISTGK